MSIVRLVALSFAVSLLSCGPKTVSSGPDAPGTAEAEIPTGWHRPNLIDGGIGQAWFDAEQRTGWATSGRNILRYEGGTWRVGAEANAEASKGVSVLWVRDDGAEGWALGASDQVMHLVDGQWTPAPVAGYDLVEHVPISALWVSADGTQGWAVGGKMIFGVVLRLEAGTWRYHGGVPAEMWSLWVSDDGTQGWAAGLNGTLLRLEKGQWVVDEASKGQTTGHIAAMDVSADGSTGWAMTIHRDEDGFIEVLRLRDGHWAIDPEHRGRIGESMGALQLRDDGQAGWATGNRGQVLRFDGQTWAVDEVASALSSQLLFMPWVSPDGEDVLLVGNGEIFERKDGAFGRRDDWGAANADHVLDAWLSPDGTKGWAFSTGGVLALRDGRWRLDEHQPKFADDSNYLNCGWVSDDGSQGWAFGTMGAGAQLRDGRWEALPRPDEEWPPSAQSLWMSADGSTGWLFTSDGPSRFVDGQWVPVPHEDFDRYSVQEVRFDATEEHGYAVTGNGRILELDGEQWRPRPEYFDTGFYALHIADDGQSGWVAGYEGFVVNMSDGVWTKDEAASALSDETWQDIWIDAEGQRGLMVGDEGTVLTLEQGQWRIDEAASAQTRRELDEVVMSDDGTVGWALGWGRLRYNGR
ncbi:MAG: hypothetical protein AAF799_34400 [Myxococcota bacterium]